jgi:hypothetical protein
MKPASDKAGFHYLIETFVFFTSLYLKYKTRGIVPGSEFNAVALKINQEATSLFQSCRPFSVSHLHVYPNHSHSTSYLLNAGQQ